MRKLLDGYRNIDRRVLFEITNNERLWYWQVVSWEKDNLVRKGTTANFRRLIRTAFRKSMATMYPKLVQNTKPRVAVHVRNSGEWPDTKDYYAKQRKGAERIAEWLGVPIHIYSEGQEKDKLRILEVFSGVPFKLHFNEEAVRSFCEMATSDVLLGGKSSFFLLSGLLSSGLKISWHNYDTELIEMIKCKNDRLTLDDEWLTVHEVLDQHTFIKHFAERHQI